MQKKRSKQGSFTRTGSKFDFKKIPITIRQSPVKLRDWLNAHIPSFVGPHIDTFDPLSGQRGTILTIHGNNFATNRADNKATIGGTIVPVLKADATQLKVLVTKEVDSGPVKVGVGTHFAQSAFDFAIKGYPGSGEDGPPLFAMGNGDGNAGDVNPIGTIRVLIVVCQAKDRIPASLPNVRTTLDNRWNSVHDFYTQASFGRTNLLFDIVNTAAQLDGNFTDFVDLSAGVQNVIPGQLSRIAAIAAKHAQDAGFDLNTYQMLCCVVFTNNAFIRAYGGSDTQTFSYDDTTPTTDPAHIHISITLTQKINLLWIHETADWGRFAHEFGHNIVSSPTVSGDGSATLREDVYGSDLVDPTAATAMNFEMMGAHDNHPIFSGYHLEKLGYYTTVTPANPGNIKELQWDRNPQTEEVDIIAHGLTEDTVNNRWHIVKINISNALSYYVEVRQRPGSTTQIFDSNIPLASAPNQGGVIVTRVIADEMHNNQQTRFITLMHADRVQIQGDIIEDPARALKITVLNEVQTRPLVCKVRIEWAQTIANDPTGAFDLNIEPWDTNWQSPDIWVDRDPFGSFDNPNDAQGRPTGNGDRPWVNHLNHFAARVHVSGAMGASNVSTTFYAVTPPGVGDNGNWSPIAVPTPIANIPPSGFRDIFCNWVPVTDKHSCLKVFASQQLGEISGGNNGAQENVFQFQAAGGSPVDPLFIKTAVRNPLDEPRAIHMSMHGLPVGWSAQIPHAWIWLDGKAEKEIEVMVWPTADVNAYKFGKNKEGQCPGACPLRIPGFIERSYGQELGKKHMIPGSRFYPIGGVFYQVDVRNKADIIIDDKQEQDGKKENITVRGIVKPSILAQRILIDAMLPDGKTNRMMETKTNSTGQFNAVVSILDNNGKILSGQYRIQAFIFHASDLADCESNIVYITR